MLGRITGSMLVAFAISGTAQAQHQVQWSAPPTATEAAQTTYFPMGTPLTLITRTQVSTKVNKPGDRFYLEVAETLSYNGQAVIPAGSIAVGEVVRSDRNGHFGKKGKLDIRLLYVETPHGPVRLTGHAFDEGTSGTITSIATMVFATPLGFLVHGTSAHLPFGTTVQSHLAEPMRFVVQPEQQMMAAKVVQADNVRMLPVRFEPSSGVAAASSSRR